MKKVLSLIIAAVWLLLMSSFAFASTPGLPATPKNIKTLSSKTIPQKVTGLKAAEITKTTVKLKWKAASGGSFYKVEKSTDGKKWSKVDIVDKTTITVEKLKSGTKYQFRVKALDKSKKVAGDPSAVLKVQTKLSKPKITSLKSSEAKKATVKWEKVTGAKSYTVYKSTDNKNWTKVKSGITKTSYTLTGLTGGKKIYVKIQAIDASGQKSSKSSAKSVTVLKETPVPKLTNSSFKKLYKKAAKVAEDWLFIPSGCTYSEYGNTIYIGKQDDSDLREYGEYVNHKSINTVAKLKKYLSKYFTKAVYESTVDKYYRDINGHLYFIGNYGIGGPDVFELIKATVTEQNSKTAKGRITIKDSIDGYEEGTYTKTVKLKYVNNKWVFDKPFYTTIYIQKIPYESWTSLS